MAVRSPLFVVVSFAIAISGCDSPIEQSPCKDVPAGGCPLSHGKACDDPACQAAYACNPDGTWTLDHVCPADAQADADADAEADAEADAGAGAGADADAGPGADAGAWDVAWIDAPPGASGGPGCIDLEPPDCPLSAALACPAGCCNCEDLYVCDNGGWTQWGVCDPDAGIHR